MKILITGATGFVGQRLVARLKAAGDEVAVVSRNADRAAKVLNDVTAHAWQPLSGPPPAEALAGVEAVYNLAGEPVAEGRWTDEKKKRIRDSRVIGTRHLVQGIREATSAGSRPPVLVSASAVGYYGSRADEILNEASSPGHDFLAQVCRDWETEALEASAFGSRVALPRIGIVLGRGGGALAKMLTPFKLGLGGRLGNGHQWMPWVHVDDLVEMFRFAATHHEIAGPFNAVSPHPVTNRDFTKALAAVLHRPAIFPVPGFALRLLLGEFVEVLLGSQRAVPQAIQTAGYPFQFPELPPALDDVVNAKDQE